MLVLTIAAFGAGCTVPGDADNADNNVILNIESVSFVSDPFGDVLTSGGTILDDTVSVDLSAVLKAAIATDPNVVTPDLQNIALDRYEVTFTRTDGGTAVPPGFTRGVSGLVRLSVPQASAVTALTVPIVLVPSTIKAQPPISFLISPGSEPATNFTNIQVDARVQFFGRTLSGHPVTVVGHIGINFANFGDDNE